jgi:hypothetical protein
MQSDVGTLVAVQVDLGLGSGLQVLAIRGLIALHVGPDDVVGGSWRYALGKLARVVGVEFPAGLLFVGPPDLDLDAVDGMVRRVPDGAENQRVRLFLGFLLGLVSVLGLGICDKQSQ